MGLTSGRIIECRAHRPQPARETQRPNRGPVLRPRAGNAEGSRHGGSYNNGVDGNGAILFSVSPPV